MNCLITGASVGIGAALASKLASLNYNLYLTYYERYKEISKLKEELEKKYQIKCFIKKLDLKSENEISEVIQDFNNKLGQLDLLINNAATYNDNLFMEKSKEEFSQVLEVNIIGTFLVSKYALKFMPNNSLIINMASTDGIDTFGLYNIDYAVSKAGIITLTKNMALIFPNIKILAIAPNWVDTESTGMIEKKYLESELKRINQKELIKVETIVQRIVNCLNDSNIKSGEVIRIDEN